MSVSQLEVLPTAAELQQQLVHLKVRVPLTEISLAIEQLHASADVAGTAREMALHWASAYRQINPEYLINLDFAVITQGQLSRLIGDIDHRVLITQRVINRFARSPKIFTQTFKVTVVSQQIDTSLPRRRRQRRSG